MSKLSVHPVSERRLRPIYDWLDNGNNKKALQEAEKVLKKQPTLQCAKVLKCLALLRLGKESDSIEQLETIRKECPIDDATLQLMTVCYREIHKPHLICELYEWAYQKDPQNEEILTNLFLSYVRIADYEKQKKTAFNLYRVKPKNQYYFWAIISLLIQTSVNLSDLMQYFSYPMYTSKGYPLELPTLDNEKSVSLKLAERMVEKHVNEKKIETDQEVLIYLIILEMEGKLKEALDIINSPLGEKLEETTVINKRIDLLIKLKKWPQANELLRTVLYDDIDSWNYILLYLDTVFEMGQGRNIKEEHDCPFTKANSFLNELIDMSVEQKFKKRGPFLAQLEFYSRLINHNLPAEKFLGSIIQLIMNYIREFGTKEACLHDLRPYLHLSSSIELLSRVYQLTSLNHGEFPETKEQMNLHLINLELVRVFGIREFFPCDEKIHFVNTMVQYFVHGISFNDNLPATETRSNDRYALLAIHSLYELWADTGESNYLFEGLIFINFALQHSPSNSQFKIFLIKFYHMLGGSEAAHAACIGLDLKHMQLDSLGYLHLFPLLANANYSTAGNVLNLTLKFFTNNFRESADHITFAYKYDALIKIPEFIHIRDKLNNSSHYRLATVEKMLLDVFLKDNYNGTVSVINEMEILPHVDDINWAFLQDNRDFSVIWDIGPESRRLTAEAIQQTYYQDIAFLRFRSLLLRIYSACIRISQSEIEILPEPDTGYDSGGSNISSNYSASKATLYKLLVELENNLETLQSNKPNGVSKRFILAPPASRLLLMIQCNYFDVIVNELHYVMNLLPGEHSNKDKSSNYLDSSLLFFDEYLHVVSDELIKCDEFSTRNLVIQMFALYVELISFSCMIAGVIDSVMRKFKQSLIKKNKKKKETQQKNILDLPNEYEWRLHLHNRYISVLVDNIKTLEMILRNEEKVWREKHVGNLSVIRELKDEEQNQLMSSMAEFSYDCIVNSCATTVNHICTALKNKIKFMNSHKL